MFSRKIPQKPIPASSQLSVSIEDDYIYIIKAKNRYGLVVTIGVEATQAKADKVLEEFKTRVNDGRYWKDGDGNIQVGIERKLVPPSAKKPLISSPRE